MGGCGLTATRNFSLPTSQDIDTTGALLPTRTRPAATVNPATYLSVSQPTQTVTLTLLAGLSGANDGYNFNGSFDGEMTVTVPQGWHVVVRFRNVGVFPASAAVVMATSMTYAFAGAELSNTATGLPVGASGSFSFTAAAAGTYRIVDPVVAHLAQGMWATLVVAPGATPSIHIAAAPPSPSKTSATPGG